MLKITRGNKVVLKWLLTADGETLDNLASATKIIYAMKKSKTDDNVPAVNKIVLEQTYPGTEDQIKRDDPAGGWVKVTLKPSDTDVDEDVYYHALQVEWAADDTLEFIYGDGQIRVKQDVIR